MFGSTEQMGILLAKTFKGEQRWIRSGDIEIDAMFFSVNGEKLDDGCLTASYKNCNSIIICNPNAMFY